MNSHDKYRIALVQPPLQSNSRHKRIMPLSLAYMAATVRAKFPQEVEVRIVDAQVNNWGLKETWEQLCTTPYNLIGITCWTPQAPFAYRLAAAIRAYLPETRIILGGVHPTVRPEEAVHHAHYLVCHEGEETLTEIVANELQGKSSEEVSGVALLKDGNLVMTTPRPFIQELDQLPFPAWDLLDIDKYTTPLHVVGGRRFPIIGSRGCPFNCTYCVSPIIWKRKVRFRSPANVVDEMEEIIRRYQVPQFHFWDDNLYMYETYLRGLCEEIIKRDLGTKIRWTGLTRAEHVHHRKDMLGLIKQSGCIGIEIGIESANPDTFKQIQKEESLQTLYEACRLQKEHDMAPMFTYMAFNPGETISGYYLQGKFIDDLLSGLPWYEHFHPLEFPLYVGQFCTLHPGTQLYKERESVGSLLDESWENFMHHNLNFVPQSLLDDVPVRTTDCLDEYSYIVALKAISSTLWDEFPRELERREKIVRLYRYKVFLSNFYRHAKGELTLKQVALRVGEYLVMTRKQALRYAAFSSLILAQLGLLKSGLGDPHHCVQRKYIDIPGYDKLRRNYRLFKIAGPLYSLLRR